MLQPELVHSDTSDVAVASRTILRATSARHRTVKRWNQNQREQLVLGASLLIAYVSLAVYLVLVKNFQLGDDALARLVNAYLVFYGNEAKLASIGFVWPPIPTLLLLPLTWMPTLVHTLLAVVIVSAAFTAWSGVLVSQIAVVCGVPNGWRRLFVLIFAVNPLVLIFAINGYSEAVLIAVTLSAVYRMILFWQSGNNKHMITAGLFFSFLPLIRYEMALLTAGSVVLIAAISWRHVQQQHITRPHIFFEGRLLAYGVLAVYPTVLWIIFSWQIMGSPLYFLANDRSHLSVAELQIAGLDTQPIAAFQTSFGLWTAAFPAGLLASLAAIIVALRRRSLFLAGLALLAFVIPTLQGVLLTQRTTVPLIRYFIIAVPLAFAVGLAAFYALTSQRPTARFRHWLLGGAALVLAASNVSSAALLQYGQQYQTVEILSWATLTTSQQGTKKDVADALAVGTSLAQRVPSGSKILIDEYARGFAIVLGARNPKLFVDHTHHEYQQALRKPATYVDYVLLPQPQRRGKLNEVNRFHPTLYDQGAPWAELVDGLPPSFDGWRLYRVRK